MSELGSVVPFVVNDEARKQPFSEDMELAAIICMAESERKKSGFLDRSSENLDFICKMHYPIWLMPFRGKCLLLDGMFTTEARLASVTPSDPETFIEHLKRHANNLQMYREALNEQQETFAKFAEKNGQSVEGLIVDEGLISAFRDLISLESADSGESHQNVPLLNPRIDGQEALKIYEKIRTHSTKLESSVKGLGFALSSLDEQSKWHIDKVKKELQQTGEEFDTKLSELKSQVAQKKANLMKERDAKTDAIVGAHGKEVAAKISQKHKLDDELLKLEQAKAEYEKRKKLREKKKDEVGKDRWKVRARNVKQQISTLRNKSRTLSTFIDQVQKEDNKSTAKVQSAYQKLLDEEDLKVSDLQEKRDSLVAEANGLIEEIEQSSQQIGQKIRNLIEQIKEAMSNVERSTMSRKVEKPIVMGIPFYAVRYDSKNSARYGLQSPVIAQAPGGIMMKIRKTFHTGSLDRRIGTLLKPRNRDIEIFFETFRTLIEKNPDLDKIVNGMSGVCNVLKKTGLTSSLESGLAKLEEEGWIGPGERVAILRSYGERG